MKLSKVHPEDIAHYPATYIAVFIDAGLMIDCPLAWTQRGRAIVRRRHHIHGKGYDGVAVFEDACHMLPYDQRPTFLGSPFETAPLEYARNKQQLRRLTGAAKDEEAID